MPLPGPDILGTRAISASWRCRISAMSRCRRISARCQFASTGALPQAVRSSGAAAAWRASSRRRLSPVRHRVRRREADWELDFFLKHFLEGYRGVQLPRRRARLRAECASMARELAAEPRVLCHRDYHSRNLMLRERATCTSSISRMRGWAPTRTTWSRCCGTPTSISPDATVDELMALLPRARARPSPASGRATFRRRFDLMALQRNLKALGTFGYQTTARGIRSTSSTCRARCATCAKNLERYPTLRAAARIAARRRTSRNCASREQSRSCLVRL